MKIPRFYHRDVNHEVIALLRTNFKPGEPISDRAIDIAREMVWAKHCLETIEWKEANMTLKA